MRLEEPEQENPWYLSWALKSVPHISQSITAGWHAYNSIRELPVRSCREYFGGMGAQSLIIRELFRPEYHVVMDYAPGSVEHLKRTLQWDDIYQADAYSPESFEPADLVALDFGDMTVWKTREGQPHRQLLDRVFSAEPQAVVITDIAGPRLGLHRSRYESLLGPGSCASQETYLNALVYRFESLYGYTLAGGFYHRGAAKLAMVPSGTLPPRTVEMTPSSPVGLELL